MGNVVSSVFRAWVISGCLALHYIFFLLSCDSLTLGKFNIFKFNVFFTSAVPLLNLFGMGFVLVLCSFSRASSGLSS